MKKAISKFSLLLICFVSLSSQLQAQCQINIEIMELFCITDTTYTLVVDINTANLPGNSLEVSINDELLGQFDVDAFPLTLSDIVHNGDVNAEISICSVDDNSCCGILGYEPPTSYCADCLNYWVETEFSCDTDSTYEFILTPVVAFPDQMAPSGNLLVLIDGNTYELEYEIGNSYTISGVEFFPNTVWHEIQWFFVEPDCGVAVLLVASPDCQELCTLDSIEVTDFICTSETTYNMVVNPIWAVPAELYFLDVEISVNGEPQGVYSQDSLPYTVLNIPTSENGISSLEICVPGIPFDACCYTLEYEEPNCGTTGVLQLYGARDVQIYPNPAHDIIQIENVEGELFIYNSSGSLMLHKKQIGQQIEVGLLPAGIYYIEVRGDFIRRAKFIKH
ncbi:MAG: T9SS type A sorting domain-containing protein [Saprospiraceae bacterium]